MIKTFKYRLYPTLSQEVLINKHLGACRWVWNYALERRISAHKDYGVSLSKYDIQNDLPRLKQEFEWLNEINAQSLQNVIISDLEKAYTKFFKEKKGFPKFKSKHTPIQSFCVPQAFKLEKNKLSIGKFRSGLKIKMPRPFEGKIKSIRIVKTNTNKFYACLACEVDRVIIQKPMEPKTAIGIDVGLAHFLTTSSGLKVENPRIYQNHERRLKVLQKRLSKKQKDSKNRIKAKLKVAKYHEWLANKRNDFLHKLTTRMVNENQVNTFVIEDLGVQEMAQDSFRSKAIYDVSWSKFYQLLSYKCEWAGKNLIRIGRYEPSSKLCSACGRINKTLTLIDRIWTCPSCGAVHDRDINAAINIKSIGLCKRNTGQELPGGPVEMPALAGSVKQEIQSAMVV